MPGNLSKVMDVAVDGGVFEGGGGMAKYTKEVMRRLPEVRFWVIHRMKIEIGEEGENKNIVKVKLPIAGKYLPDQIVISRVLVRLGNPVYWQPANYGVPILSGSKVLLTVHDLVPLTWKEYFSKSRIPWVARLVYRARMQLGLWRADRIMVDSRETRLHLVRRFWVDNSKIAVVPMGVELRDRDRDRDGGVLIRHQLGRKQYILNNGGIDRRKNLERLIESFYQIINSKDENPRNLKLVITGKDTGLRKELDIEIDRLKIERRIVFTGRIPDWEVRELLLNAAVVAYPSLAEGFGLPVLEAMASGVPVVVSNLPVLRWIGGSVPYYVDPESVGSIAEGIRKALGTRDRDRRPRKRWGKARAGEFSWERTAEGVRKEFEGLIC